VTLTANLGESPVADPILWQTLSYGRPYPVADPILWQTLSCGRPYPS
jgi:hypothetical protein